MRITLGTIRTLGSNHGGLTYSDVLLKANLNLNLKLKCMFVGRLTNATDDNDENRVVHSYDLTLPHPAGFNIRG